MSVCVCVCVRGGVAISLPPPPVAGAVTFYAKTTVHSLHSGRYKEISSIFADQCGEMGGGGWGLSQWVLSTAAAVNITWHGALINFRDLPPYLTYDCIVLQLLHAMKTQIIKHYLFRRKRSSDAWSRGWRRVRRTPPRRRNISTRSGRRRPSSTGDPAQTLEQVRRQLLHITLY